MALLWLVFTERFLSWPSLLRQLLPVGDARYSFSAAGSTAQNLHRTSFSVLPLVVGSNATRGALVYQPQACNKETFEDKGTQNLIVLLPLLVAKCNFINALSAFPSTYLLFRGAFCFVGYGEQGFGHMWEQKSLLLPSQQYVSIWWAETEAELTRCYSSTSAAVATVLS